MNGEDDCCSSSYGSRVPFFTRPFGTMFGCTGGLFGPAGFAAMRSLLLLRFHSSAFESRGVYVEELLDDFEETFESTASNYQQHTVEHPDDVDNSFENSSFQTGHGGLENLCCSFSSQRLGQVRAVVEKRNITCTKFNFNTGYVEPPRKRLKC